MSTTCSTRSNLSLYCNLAFVTTIVFFATISSVFAAPAITPIPITGISWCSERVGCLHNYDGPSARCAPSPDHDVEEIIAGDRICRTPLTNETTDFNDNTFGSYWIQTTNSIEKKERVKIVLFNDTKCTQAVGSIRDLTPNECQFNMPVTMDGNWYIYYVIHANIPRVPSTTHTYTSSSCCSWYVYVLIGFGILMLVLSWMLYQKKKRPQSQTQLQTSNITATQTPYQPLLTNQV